MKDNVKNLVFVIRTTPFNTVALSEAFRMAVGITVYDNKISILLIDDGVWNAMKLSSHFIGRPDVYESLELFSACGVSIYADETSLRDREISGHENHIKKISRVEAFKLISGSDFIMSFK